MKRVFEKLCKKNNSQITKADLITLINMKKSEEKLHCMRKNNKNNRKRKI